ncbi:MAG: hypothetical protein WCI53_07090 [Bacteroidota bacterium]
MMKLTKIMLAVIIIAATITTILPSCQKGDDDPIISLKTRKDRFTNTWTLTKYEKNSVSQDLNGATYIYNAFNSGSLTRTIEGSIFGYPTRIVSDGTWSFLNDDEDVKVTIGGSAEIYNIQRLASKELWLKRTDNADTYVYYFSGL